MHLLQRKRCVRAVYGEFSARGPAPRIHAVCLPMLFGYMTPPISVTRQ